MSSTKKSLIRAFFIMMLFIALGVFSQTGQSVSEFSQEPLPTIEVTLLPGVEWATVRSLNVETTTIWQEDGQVFGISSAVINSARDVALYHELVAGRLNSLPDEQILTAEVTFKDSLSLAGIESVLAQYTIISLLASGVGGSTGHVAYPPENIPVDVQEEFSQVYEALSGGTPSPSLSPDNYIAATVKASAALLHDLAQKERVLTVDVGPVDLISYYPNGDFSSLKDVSYDYESYVGSVCEFTLLRNRINELSTNGEIPVAVRDELNGLLTNAEIHINANNVASARSEMALFFETLTENSTTISENALKETGLVGDCLVVREMQSDPVVDAGNDQTVDPGNAVTINATYTDADHTESHSARIDWGDGTIEDVAVNMTGPGAGEVTGEHTYANAGNYTVEVCVTDLYGGVGCDTVNVTVNANGFPTTPILDNFNRANGPIGSNWSGNTSAYNISSNQLSVDDSGTVTDIYWGNEAFGPDQEAYVTFTHIDPYATEQDLLLKGQSNSTWGDGVLEVLYDPAGQRAQVWTWKWPEGWVQHGEDLPVTFGDGDTFGARARADGIVEVYKNGTLLGTRDITAWSHYAASGYIGLWFLGAEDAMLDDFGGGTLPGGEMSMSLPVGPAESEDPTPEQLDVNLQDATLFWQGIPLGSSQQASVTFANIPTLPQGVSLKPHSNGIWGEGIVQVLYDVARGRLQVWMYQSGNGWVQSGRDVAVRFVAGDTFRVRALADGTVEIYRNGRLLAQREVIP
jgi:hypothetical protein